MRLLYQNRDETWDNKESQEVDSLWQWRRIRSNIVKPITWVHRWNRVIVANDNASTMILTIGPKDDFQNDTGKSKAMFSLTESWIVGKFPKRNLRKAKWLIYWKCIKVIDWILKISFYFISIFGGTIRYQLNYFIKFSFWCIAILSWAQTPYIFTDIFENLL